MARIKKDNIEREVADAVKAKFIDDGWKEVQPNYKAMKMDDLRALATEKGLTFESDIKKDELIKLLEGAN